MRTILLSVLLLASSAWACSLQSLPSNALAVDGGVGIDELADAGVDTTAPGKPTVTAVVTLVKNGCNGAGFACPQLDSLKLTLTASDDLTPGERLRYLAHFGATEAEATTAPGSLLFEHDLGDATAATAWLGFGGKRSEDGFQRATLCFAISAVDAAGNVGLRSDAQCVDTKSDVGATLVQGAPCGATAGCSMSAGVPFLLALLGYALRRR